MIQMHPKSFKKCRKLMRFLEMMIKELSLTLMVPLVNSLGWGEDIKEDSAVIWTQRNYSEQSSGTRARDLLLETLATSLRVVEVAQNSLTLVLRSTMST